MKETITTEQRVCIECKADYEAKILSVKVKTMDGTKTAKYVLGQGRCKACCQKIFDDEIAREQLVISSTRRKWRSQCGIPSKFMNEEFGTLDLNRPVVGLKEVYKRCLSYAEKFPVDNTYLGYPSLIILSESSWGVGKTHLACSIAHKILNQWKGEGTICPVKYVSEPELFERIYDTFSHSKEEQTYLPSKADIINELLWSKLLIIDDIGKRKPRDMNFVQETLYLIINGRYDRKMPMIITSNLSPKKLEKYLGGSQDSASYDRLWEMCQGKVLKLEGESYRRKK